MFDSDSNDSYDNPAFNQQLDDLEPLLNTYNHDGGTPELTELLTDYEPLFDDDNAIEEWFFSLLDWEQGEEEEFLNLIDEHSASDSEVAEYEEVQPIPSTSTAPVSLFNNNNKRRRTALGERERKRLRLDQYGAGLPGFKLIFDWETISESRPVISPTFNRESITTVYKLTHNLDAIDIMKVSDDIDKMFQTFIQPSLDKCGPRDVISVIVRHEELHQPLFVNARKFRFNHQNFANGLFSLSQSNSTFLFNGELEVQVDITKTPVGGGRGRKNVRPQTVEEFNRDKQSIILIKNNDNSCGYRSVALAKFYQDKNRPSTQDPEWKATRQNKRNPVTKVPRQEELARALCVDAGLDYDQPLDDIGFRQLDVYLEPLGYQLIVLNGATLKARVHEGLTAAKQLYIMLHNNHYNMVKSITGYMGVSYWCSRCWVGSNTDNRHRCPGNCTECFQYGQCAKSDPIGCTSCNREFNNNICYQQHLAKKVCEHTRKCIHCELVYQTRHPHVCNKTYCRNCEANCEIPHYCYIRACSLEKLQADDSKTNKICISFDIESQINADKEHQAILVCAQISCDTCWNYNDDTKTNDCIKCFNGDGQFTFAGLECVTNFSQWIYKTVAVQAQATKSRVYVFAHNFKGYDGHFIMKELFNLDYKNIEPIMSGSKLLKIDINNVRFICTLSLFNQKLESLPKSFGFEDKVIKGYFPHLFNTFERLAYNGPWPGKEFYEYTKMDVDAQKKFDNWYSKQTGIFNLKDETLKYCRDDVNVLNIALHRFRHMCSQKLGIDPITRSFTISSFNFEAYRANFLKDFSMAKVPATGYSPRVSSMFADAYLDTIEEYQEITIDREKKMGKYYVDGQHHHTIYEVFGCHYHGCLKPSCNPDPDRMSYLNKTPRQLNQETQEKLAYYARLPLISVIAKWECEIEAELDQNCYLKTIFERRLKYYQTLKEVGHINIRDSFFGGRTNNFRFYKEIDPLNEDEYIEYKDVTSLYPFVCKTKLMPEGHPRLIRNKFDKTLKSYNGIVKCKMLAPRQLVFGVLPSHVDGKLLFHLCEKCALEKRQSTCDHSDEDRAFIGTWVTPELHLAIRKGYKVIEVYEVLQWDSMTDEFFKGQVKMWMKIKTEASGWPDDCKTEEQRRQFIQDFLDIEGVQLDPENMVRNEPARSLAKMMLNCLWGKLAQRSNLPQTTICTEPSQYWALVDDERIKITGECMPTLKTLVVCWEYKDDIDCDSGNTNIAIAAFVTAYARIHLYELMNKVAKNGYSHLLYVDTDSIIYISKPDDKYKLDTGNFFGGLTSEVPDGARITKFVSCGPKNYAYEYQLATIQTNEDGFETTVIKTKSVVKTKGIRNDALTLQTLNVRFMTNLVKQYIRGKELRIPKTIPQRVFVSDKFSHIVKTHDVDKTYRVVSEKRRIVGNHTLPYGFVDPV